MIEKIGQKEILGSIVWISLSNWTKDMKIIVSHVNVHKKLTSVDGEFNSQVDRMWTLHHFSKPFLSLPSGPMNKMAMVAQIEVMHGLNNINFYSLKLTWLQLLMNADLSAAETNCEFLIWHHSSGWPPSDLVAHGPHQSNSFMERTMLCYFWSRYIFWWWSWCSYI